MRQIIVSQNEEGRRLDKYLLKYFSKAPASFVYKMLRKKNIELNEKKNDGSAILKGGDEIKLFLSDETIEKFTGIAFKDDLQATRAGLHNSDELFKTYKSEYRLSEDLYKKIPPVVYEDDNILIANKPSGMLSQKSSADSYSFNEIALSYLKNKGQLNEKDMISFMPSVVNRLDRNTSGLILFAKNYTSAKSLSEAIKHRSIHKYYKCIVNGRVNEPCLLKGRHSKNKADNLASISDFELEYCDWDQEVSLQGKDVSSNDNADILTKLRPVAYNDSISLLEVLLITGKTHQIRAHLSASGHAIVGDYKYGIRKINDAYKNKLGINSQLLCAYKLEFPVLQGRLGYLSNKIIEIDLPHDFKRVLKDGNLEVKRS